MGFSELLTWAQKQEEEVRAIVSNVAGDARYEDAGTADAFRNKLSAEWEARGGDALDAESFRGIYIGVCAQFQLKGQPIPLRQVPERVCRVVQWPSLSGQIAGALGMDSAFARDHIRPLAAVGLWGKADAAISVSGKTPSTVSVRLAGGGPSSARRAVFAAFEVESPANPQKVSTTHNRLWERLRRDAAGGDLAGYAVSLLGLTPLPVKPPPPPQERVLAEYAAETFNEWRVPVPPDARYNGLFRAVTPGMLLA